MNGIQNKKRMYDYCCQRIICHKEILSRIIQEYVNIFMVLKCLL